MKLLIDDLRSNYDVDYIARDYNDGIKQLKNNSVDLLYLDHDLGGHKTGYDIMCWIEQNTNHRLKEIICVSSNPVGRQRIEKVISKIYNLSTREIQSKYWRIVYDEYDNEE